MELQDHFLIAMPHLEDEYFHRSVVYICEHTQQGAMGLVINHTTDLSVAELCAKMNFLMINQRQHSEQLVLAGGPVSLERGFILHSKTKQDFLHSYKVTEQLQLTTSADIIDTLGTIAAPEKYLIALGCASWSSNQLEKEIANNDWLVVPANEQILFDTPYEQRWIAAQGLLGIQYHHLSYQAGNS